MYKIDAATGDATEVAKMTFKQVQEYVGGYVERVRCEGDRWLLVNEEGVINGSPVNTTASVLVGGPIYGNVVAVTAAEMKKILK
jgi:hypothetical protein